MTSIEEADWEVVYDDTDMVRISGPEGWIQADLIEDDLRDGKAWLLTYSVAGEIIEDGVGKRTDTKAELLGTLEEEVQYLREKAKD